MCILISSPHRSIGQDETNSNASVELGAAGIERPPRLPDDYNKDSFPLNYRCSSTTYTDHANKQSSSSLASDAFPDAGTTERPNVFSAIGRMGLIVGHSGVGISGQEADTPQQSGPTGKHSRDYEEPPSYMELKPAGLFGTEGEKAGRRGGKVPAKRRSNTGNSDHEPEPTCSPTYFTTLEIADETSNGHGGNSRVRGGTSPNDAEDANETQPLLGSYHPSADGEGALGGDRDHARATSLTSDDQVIVQKLDDGFTTTWTKAGTQSPQREQGFPLGQGSREKPIKPVLKNQISSGEERPSEHTSLGLKSSSGDGQTSPGNISKRVTIEG